jgi:hypothetical protein
MAAFAFFAAFVFKNTFEQKIAKVAKKETAKVVRLGGHAVAFAKAGPQGAL